MNETLKDFLESAFPKPRNDWAWLLHWLVVGRDGRDDWDWKLKYDWAVSEAHEIIKPLCKSPVKTDAIDLDEWLNEGIFYDTDTPELIAAAWDKFIGG